MELNTNHIPPEYLALKINYCKKQLLLMPEIKMQTHVLHGVPTQIVLSDGHRHKTDTELGKRMIEEMRLREYYERQLEVYEAMWYADHRGEPFADCVPHEVKRTLYYAHGQKVLLNKDYFDSLEDDANYDYPKNHDFPFNGHYYRSAGERDIAIYYTEMGIPFKTEPAVYLAGMARPIHPDFVAYIKELDNCKFHEHFGVKSSSSYLRTTSIKYQNYTNAGLVPELDVLFTHDVQEMPFDIRSLSSKLNYAIYTTAIVTQPPQKEE